MEDNRFRREGENNPQRGRREGARPRKQTDRGNPVSDNQHEHYSKPYRRDESAERPHSDHPRSDRPRTGKPGFKSERPDGKPAFRKQGGRPSGPGSRKPAPKGRGPAKKPFLKGKLAPTVTEEDMSLLKKPTHATQGLVRLNKYISNAGICSRRDADKLIEAGSVTVNGEVVTKMGYLVKEGDVVAFGGETRHSEPKRYFLLNKPKGYITTLDDPQERQTVMELMANACRERIYPVGRLDRNTTGLLLFTNDGEMAKKLTHPSTGVYKVYRVELDKPVSKEDMQHMREGIELDDGIIRVDEVAYDYNPAERQGIDKRVVGVQLHSGKNRIVRRIFESMGYTVHKLDRTVFAGLTKKDLPRGRYRELTEREVNFLKMI